MMHRRMAVLAAAVLLLASAFAWPLELTRGRIRLVLHEDTGRFSLYSVSAEGGRSEYTALFVAQDPRTSKLSLVVDNRVYVLGDSGEFKQTAEKTGQGARFLWESRLLQVEQRFSFIAPSGSTIPGGVLISLELTNRADRQLQVGARLLLDTYLGEDGTSHFRTDRDPQVTREMTVTRSDMIRYWVSTSVRRDAPEALESVTSGPGITEPDRIVFANWKRLSDSPWAYQSSPSRNFNLLPYSINDSAVAQYYDPAPLAPGATRTIAMLLGNYSPQGYHIEGAPAEAPAAAGPPAPVPSAGQEPASGSQQEQAAEQAEGEPGEGGAPLPTTLLLLSEVQTLNTLLARIDRALASGQPVPEEELSLMREILSDIKSRSGQEDASR